MGDSRRFDEFAKVIARNIPKEFSIADVAGGKGYLQSALRQLGFRNITSWDKRPKNASNRTGYRWGFFNYKTDPEYQAVVAMHPDEGTDEALMFACTRKVPAIICPCCVKPSAITFWGSHSDSKSWMDHLTKVARQHGMDVIWTTIPITGKNHVMIVKPRRK
jgi:hypothetical protein